MGRRGEQPDLAALEPLQGKVAVDRLARRPCQRLARPLAEALRARRRLEGVLALRAGEPRRRRGGGVGGRAALRRALVELAARQHARAVLEAEDLSEAEPLAMLVQPPLLLARTGPLG